MAYKHNGGTLEGGFTANKIYVDQALSFGDADFTYPTADSMGFKACKAVCDDGRIAVVMGLRV